MNKLAAALLLVTLGALASPAAVPVYDGIGTDEPYRYVGGKPAPTSATATAPVRGGVAGSLQARSGETGPQVLLDLGSGGFASSAPSVTLTVTPLRGDGERAPQGRVDGNVYRVVASPGARLLRDQVQGFLFLRAAVMTRPDPVVVHRDSPADPWTAVRTVRAGRDVLSTPFRALGDYAAVRPPGAKPLSAGRGLGTSRLLLLGVGVLVLVVLTVLVLRRSATDED
jgi:hypothetical protein